VVQVVEADEAQLKQRRHPDRLLVMVRIHSATLAEHAHIPAGRVVQVVEAQVLSVTMEPQIAPSIPERPRKAA
jgi:hypothetical protein